MSWRAIRRDEAGVSLPELMVAMLIFSVVGVGLTTIAIGVMRATAKAETMTTDQGGARNAVAVMTRDIRTAIAIRRTEAPAFRVAEHDEVQFTGLLGSSTRPQLIRIKVEPDGRIVEDATPPNTGTYEGDDLDWDPEADGVLRHVTSYVVNDPDEPLFRYFDAAGNELDPGTDGLVLAQRRLLTSVRIRLAVSSDQLGRTGKYVIESQVRLPNASTGSEDE